MTVAHRPGLWIAIVVGLFAGFLSGLFGVGGGILIVPALVLALGMDQRRAHGTSLVAVIPIALAGVVGYATEDRIDWSVAAALAVGSVVGAVIGTAWLHRLSTRLLAISFAVVLLVSAVRLLFEEGGGPGRTALDALGIVVLVIAGLAAGTLGGLLGVGGGVVMVPVMVIGFDLAGSTAKGTSLAVVLPMAIVATTRNRRRQNADMSVGWAVGLAGVASAFVATDVSIGLDESVSNGLFAALLLIVAIRMVVTARRPEPEAAPGSGLTADTAAVPGD